MGAGQYVRSVLRNAINHTRKNIMSEKKMLIISMAAIVVLNVLTYYKAMDLFFHGGGQTAVDVSAQVVEVKTVYQTGSNIRHVIIGKRFRGVFSPIS